MYGLGFFISILILLNIEKNEVNTSENLDYKKVTYNKGFTVNSQKYKYDMIFIVEPWNKIYKKDQERYESFNQLIDIDYFIKETYRDLGYQYNIIPNGTIQQRVDYILNEIQ